MNEHYKHILIFKSNILTVGDVYRVSTALDMHPLIEKWCVDLDDEERILRVVSQQLNHRHIIDLVSRCGYNCEELKD